MTLFLHLGATVLVVGMAQAPAPAQQEVLDFTALDKDRNGTLSVSEVLGTSLAERFGALDTDKNGVLDKAEFDAAKGKGEAKK